MNPADIAVGSARLVPESLADDLNDDLPSSSKRAEREGLPPGYRMRADAHYVEALTGRAERPADHARAARRAEVAEPEKDAHPDARDRRDSREGRDRLEARDWRIERLLAQLTDDLHTIESSATVLAGGVTSVAQRVSVDLVRSHAWRAAWLVRAGAMLEGASRGRVRPRPIGGILARLRDGFAPECRLSSITLHVHTSDWNASVAVDEQELLTGLCGGVIATIGLLGQTDGAVIKVTVSAHGGELRTVEIVQDDESVPASVGQRFFDPQWGDRPGGWVAGLGAWTARSVVQRHGGEAALIAGDRYGTTLRLSFVRAS